MTFLLERLPAAFNVARHFVLLNVEGGDGRRSALHWSGGTITYDEVHQNVARAAGVIQGIGVAREQRVALLLPDSPELAFLFWGAIWAGCVPVPINMSCSADDVAYILDDSRARLLVTTTERDERQRRCPNAALGDVLRVDGDPPLRSLLESVGEGFEPVATARDEPAFWLYTSGSTGRPKAVVHAHHSMVVCAELYAKQTLGLTREDVGYSVAKIPFAYGLGNTLYMPMSVGASAVLSDGATAFDVVADVEQYRPTVLWAVPATYSALLAIADTSPLDCRSLRLCVSAAEELPEALWHAFRRRFGIEICEGIGTSELLHIFLSNRPGTCRPGTSGRPVTGYAVRVLDASGQECAAGEVGELEVTGESLMLGYWNRLRETRAALSGSTMRTGDRYVVDADGFYRYVGRRDDLFKVNGLWVSPLEVESVIHEHPDVGECAVVSDSPRGDGTTEVAAYVTLADGKSANGELGTQITRLAKRRLAHYKAPRQVIVLESLPRTPTGKLDRRRLRELRAETVL
jgi:benzoate-CoA ligase family protein